MERNPAAYIVASGFRGTIYTGVTSELIKRIYQHRKGSLGGFTARYGCKRLVWFEMQGDMEHAIRREKRIKNWRRDWKVALIETGNPTWRDLAEDFGFEPLTDGKVDPRIESGVTRRGNVDPGSSPG